MLWLAVLPAVAHGAQAPRIVAVSHVPLVAAAGDQISLTAKVAGTGKRVAIGLVLGNQQGSATGGLALGKGITFARRGRRSVIVPGRVPATVVVGQLQTLLVCIDPATTIGGRNTCHTAGRIATSGASSQERLAGAQQAGRLPQSRAVLFGLMALSGDKRLPSELQGDPGGAGGRQAAVNLAAASFGSLPLAIRRLVLPYFIPPPVRGSAWQANGRPLASRKAARAAAALPANCQGYDTIQKGPHHQAGDPDPWNGVPTADGKAIIWYETAPEQTPRLKYFEALDRASALNYARVFPTIWAKLTAEFGQPQSDAKEQCYHGPDGRLDVYVNDELVDINQGSSSGVALTEPYATAGTFCTNRPAYILARPGLSPWALAHEFMHVLQLSHRYVSCAEPLSWWEEGEATWAADFVYPDDNTEQKRFPDLVASALSTQLINLSYQAWPFWMMLQRTQGTGVLRSIFAQLQTQRSVAAVNAAIPGGYAEQIPRFFLSVFNQSPVGDAGFAINESFDAWDKWKQTPTLPDASTITLGSQPGDTLALPIQRKDGFPALSVGAYHRVNIPDPLVREIEFTNDLAGKPGAHVDAVLHMADGSWKLADWTSSQEVTLCRDRPGENVQDLVIVSTNTGTTPLAPFTHSLHVGASCPFPKRFDGTWTRIYTWPSRGSWTETIHGSATYVRSPLFPPEADQTSQVVYTVQSSTVNWTVSGTQNAGAPCPTQFSGSGTDTADETRSGDELGLENVSGRDGAPKPEPQPFYYSMRNTVEPSSNFEYDATDCNGTVKESVKDPWLSIGSPNPFTSSTLQSDVEKSADPRLLEGHQVRQDDQQVFTIDDTWSFAGSD
jgi:hypothetical protein